MEKKRKKNPRAYFEEVYTDKDRAAAVSFGDKKKRNNY